MFSTKIPCQINLEKEIKKEQKHKCRGITKSYQSLGAVLNTTKHKIQQNLRPQKNEHENERNNEQFLALVWVSKRGGSKLCPTAKRMVRLYKLSSLVHSSKSYKNGIFWNILLLCTPHFKSICSCPAPLVHCNIHGSSDFW